MACRRRLCFNSVERTEGFPHMPRHGAVIFGDLEGKLEVLQVACTKCDRRSHYQVAKLIERYGHELVDWKRTITADCPRQSKASVAVPDRCGAHFPDLIRLQS